jgi:hypothetical protein
MNCIENTEKSFGRNAGNSGAGGMAGRIVMLIVGIILIIGVAMPISTQVIGDQNFTGTTKTITDQIPIFLAIGSILLVIGATMFV